MALDSAKEISQDCKALLVCVEDAILGEFQTLPEEGMEVLEDAITPTEIEEDVKTFPGGNFEVDGKAAEIDPPKTEEVVQEPEVPCETLPKVKEAEISQIVEASEMPQSEEAPEMPQNEGASEESQNQEPQFNVEMSLEVEEESDSPPSPEAHVKPVQPRLHEMARKTRKQKGRRAPRRVMKKKSKNVIKKKKNAHNAQSQGHATSAKSAEKPSDKAQPAVKAMPKGKARAQKPDADQDEPDWRKMDDESLKKKVHSVS